MAVHAVVTEPSLATVLQISGHAREQAVALVALMSLAVEQEAPPSAELQADMSKAQKLLFTDISHLRGLHRAASSPPARPRPRRPRPGTRSTACTCSCRTSSTNSAT